MHLFYSYSLFMLNIDQDNVQVKNKMNEEVLIKNNQHINARKYLPRDYLFEIYHAIFKNEI